PAHCTGIATHKPTTGLVPRTGSPLGNAKGLFAQFATSGPMARNVDDLILALRIISGPDGQDPHCPPVSLRDAYEVDIGNLHVAYFVEDGISNPSDEVLSVLQTVIKELQTYVAKVDKIEPKCLKDTYRLLWEGFFLGGDKGEGTKGLLAKLGVTTPSRLLQDFLLKAIEQDLSTTQFRNLFREIDQFRITMLKTFEDYDVLISLVAGTPAKKHGTCLAESKDLAPCMVHSLTGWPVTVIRCGTSSNGLPIGIQISAKPWNDHISLALAKKLETIFGGWQQSPL
nr:amidase [Parachlamydiaceae bacterium]